MPRARHHSAVERWGSVSIRATFSPRIAAYTARCTARVQAQSCRRLWFTMAGLQGNMAGATASDRINLSLSEEERERGIAKVRRLLGQDI